LVAAQERPDAERPYRAFGYPFVPLSVYLAALAVMFVCFLNRTQTACPGLVG